MTKDLTKLKKDISEIKTWLFKTKDEQKEFLDNYHGKNHMEDHLYLEIESRARKRYNKLFEDGMKTEFERIDNLVKYLSKEFKINRDKVKDIMGEFGDTTEKLYFHIANVVGINVDTLIKLKSWKR